MYNEKKNIDDLIKESLEGFEMDFNDQDWADMESKLDRGPKGSGPSFGKRSIKSWLGGRFLMGLLLMGLFVPAAYWTGSQLMKKDYKVGNHSIENQALLNKNQMGVLGNNRAVIGQEKTPDLGTTPVPQQANKTNTQENKESILEPKTKESTSLQHTTNTLLNENKVRHSSSINNKTIEPSEQEISKDEFSSVNGEDVTDKSILEGTYQSNKQTTNDNQQRDKVTPNVIRQDNIYKEKTHDQNPNDREEKAEKLPEVVWNTTNMNTVSPASPIFSIGVERLEIIPSETTSLEPLGLSVNEMPVAQTAFKLPLKTKLKNSIQVLAGINWNFTDDVKDGKLGYETGLAYNRQLGSNWSVEAGVSWSESQFYAKDVETPAYVWGTATSAEVAYEILEIPTLIKYNFAPNTTFQPWVAAGHSLYIPINEQYFFETETIDFEETAFLNDYTPIVTSNRFASDNDEDTRGPRVGEPVNEANQVTSLFDADSTLPPNALLPSGESTRVIAGILNVKGGFDFDVNQRNSFSFNGQFKTSLTKRPFDLKLGDYGIANYKKLNSFGFQLAWNHRFG